jgi:hypothetical protein
MLRKYHKIVCFSIAPEMNKMAGEGSALLIIYKRRRSLIED